MGVEDVVDDGSEVLLPGGGLIRSECVLVSLRPGRNCSKKPCRSAAIPEPGPTLVFLSLIMTSPYILLCRYF